MTMPRGFLRVLNSGVFEVLFKGKETEIHFLRLSCGPGGWWFSTSEGEIPRADVWLLLRLGAAYNHGKRGMVAEHLRRFPADRALSVRKLAAKLGVSRDTVVRALGAPPDSPAHTDDSAD
jgi:hypothetical protein